MNTNSLKYDYCLRPTDTQFIVHKLRNNQHLNIVGTNPIHGTTRLLKDIKALETQLADVVIVYVNLREYKRTFKLFLQEVASQIGIIDTMTDFATLSYHLRKRALTSQIWLLLDELDIAMEEKHEAYSYTFLEQLNSFKNAKNITIGCVTGEALKSCSIITPDGSYGTSPLVLPMKTMLPLSHENITEELNGYAITVPDFINAIHKHGESHRFMQWLIQQIQEEKPHQKKWSINKKVDLWELSYKEKYKTLPHQYWKKLGNTTDRFFITSGLIRIKHLKDWIIAGFGGG